MKYSKKLVALVIEGLAEAISRLNPVEIVTPQNVDEAKKLWLRYADCGNFTNPVFTYDTAQLVQIANMRNNLVYGFNHLDDFVIPETADDHAIKAIILSRINSAISCTELAASILLKDDSTTSDLSHHIYGFPDNVQVLNAYNIISGKLIQNGKPKRFSQTKCKKLKALKFSADNIAYYFEKANELIGIEGWRIDVGEYTAIDVRDRNGSGKPTICIPQDRVVNGLKLIELIGHEIDSHQRSSENCKHLATLVLGEDSPLLPLVPIIAKNDDELLYEGAAKISDVNINGSTSLPMPYATIAIDQARRGGNFQEVANVIYDCRHKMGQPNDEAIADTWKTTYRVFRGCTDPSKGHYCFSKDYVYMGGYDLVKNINERYLNFSSMSLKELTKFSQYLLRPQFKNVDSAGAIADMILGL